jgi:hypothetical protein
MLCAFACLVSNVVSMLATIFNRNTRDWHTDAAHEDQLPLPIDIHAYQPILRDDCFAIPQDEAGGRFTKGQHRQKRETTKALILRALRAAQIVSTDGCGLTGLSTRIARHAHSLSSRKPRSGHPGPIHPRANLIVDPGSRSARPG